MSSLCRRISCQANTKQSVPVWCSVWYSAVLQMWYWYRPAEVAGAQLCVVVGPRQAARSGIITIHLIQSQLRDCREYYVEERRRQEGALLGY